MTAQSGRSGRNRTGSTTQRSSGGAPNGSPTRTPRPPYPTSPTTATEAAAGITGWYDVEEELSFDFSTFTLDKLVADYEDAPDGAHRDELLREIKRRMPDAIKLDQDRTTPLPTQAPPARPTTLAAPAFTIAPGQEDDLVPISGAKGLSWVMVAQGMQFDRFIPVINGAGIVLGYQPRSWSLDDLKSDYATVRPIREEGPNGKLVGIRVIGNKRDLDVPEEKVNPTPDNERQENSRRDDATTTIVVMWLCLASLLFIKVVPTTWLLLFFAAVGGGITLYLYRRDIRPTSRKRNRRS